MITHTLVLTPWMSPHRVVPWQSAVVMSYLGKVDVLEEHDEVVRSPSLSMRAPSVVRLKRPLGRARRPVPFSRANVFARDEHRCQYCGAKKPACELTFDHVVPRVQGGRTTWENIVAACRPCNAQKRGRTPDQAGMKLARRPARPTALPPATVLPPRGAHPAAWLAYCGLT
jgi:5-methylcytosine-specific restriction endonuclease McrA